MIIFFLMTRVSELVLTRNQLLEMVRRAGDSEAAGRVRAGVAVPRAGSIVVGPFALAARAGGPVLELAAGTGRLAVPLARLGHSVTAVDIDPSMLARLRHRAGEAGPGTRERLTVVEADLLELRLDTTDFALAIVALNSLFLLATRDAQRQAFRTMATHLAPWGLAAVDVWLPDADDLARFDGRLILEYDRSDPETGRRVTKLAAAQHDASTGVVNLTTIYEEGRQGEAAVRWIRRDTLRLVSADELGDFATAAGLEVETIGGDYDLGPLGSGGDRAIVVARKPGGSRRGRPAR
jgi:SAM-dependent methyltransferase